MAELFSDAFDENKEVLRQLVERLEAADEGALEIEYPCIAVMGDTSSGKSSLLSCLSGIEFPSSAELCTRCPIKVQMRSKTASSTTTAGSGDNKSITVSSETRYKVSIGGGAGTDFTSVETADPEELTNAIAKAQEAHCGGHRIRTEPIEIEAIGPQCPDLTVIDLPGIVRTVGEYDDPGLIEEIRNLLSVYLKNERCIIIPVHPANVDFHNSEIFQEAKKVDPQLNRTLPVLTKADRVAPGEEKAALSLLNGEKISFLHGFHMVRSRTSQELDDGLSLEGFAKEEKKFLRTIKQNWSQFGAVHMENWGFDRLREKLSKLYFEIVRESLPGIVEDLVEAKVKFQQDLDSLGPVMSSPLARRTFFQKLIDILNRFFETEWKQLRAGDKNYRLTALFRSIEEDFAKALLRTKLCQMDKYSLGDLYKIVKHDTVPAGTRVTLIDEETIQVPPSKKQHSFDWDWHEMKPLHIPYLIDRIKQTRSGGLVLFEGGEVFVMEVQYHVRGEWKEVCDSVADQFLEALGKLMDEARQKVVTACNITPCRLALLAELDSLQVTLDEMVKGAVAEQIDRESTKPNTANSALSDGIARARASLLYQRVCSAIGGEEISMENLKMILEAAVPTELIETTAEDVQLTLQEYAKLAAKRLGDELPMAFQDICSRILQPEYALKNLRLKDDTELEKLLQPDPQRLRRKAIIEDKISRCDSALAAVEEIHPGIISQMTTKKRLAQRKQSNQAKV